MHPLHPGVLPGLPHASRSCDFLCDKGWHLLYLYLRVGRLQVQTMLSGGSCDNMVLGARQLPSIFPTSLPSVPTTLSGGAGAVLDPGARLVWALMEVSGPPLPSCPSVFSLVGTELCSVLQDPLPCCLLGQHVGSSSVCS